MTEFHETPPTEQHQQPRGPTAADWEDLLNGAGLGREGSGPARGGLPDLSPLFFFLDAMRRAVPQELQGQFNALVREVLLTVRSLIDWYLERLERGTAEPQVEDIPIE